MAAFFYTTFIEQRKTYPILPFLLLTVFAEGKGG